MKRAYNMVPDRFADDRHGAMERGLARLGYQIVRCAPGQPTKDDVLLVWNLHGEDKRQAAALMKRVGGRVIVAEEGYLRRTWPTKHFALALDGHNGSGCWYAGDVKRFFSLGLKVEPWRTSADTSPIYVTEQRGIGSPEMRSPPDWHSETMARLRRLTKRPVIMRPHFRRTPNPVPIERQLPGAHALVTWGSSDQVRALLLGVPVFYCAPHSVVSHGAVKGITAIEEPLLHDGFRLEALRRVAWAQWTYAEIESGEPFAHLLSEQTHDWVSG